MFPVCKIKYCILGLLLSIMAVSFNANASLDLTFDYADGNYSKANGRNDFGQSSGWNDDESSRAAIENNQLRLRLKANLLSPGGILTRTALPPAKSYTFEYDVRFGEDFEWARGGKIPGISGGDGNTGCDKADDGKGWSIRLMWYQNAGRHNGDAILMPYIYHRDMPETCGDNYDYYPLIKPEKNTNYKIKVWMQTNTGDSKNGQVKIFINGQEKFFRDNLRFATVEGKHDANTFLFNVFRGGASDVWKSSRDGFVYLDNIKVNQSNDDQTTDPTSISDLPSKVRISDNWRGFYLQGNDQFDWASVSVFTLNSDLISQQWQLEKVEDNTYRIKNLWSQNYLYPEGDYDYANITMAPLDVGQSSQQWIFEKVEDNKYRIRNKSTDYYLKSNGSEGHFLVHSTKNEEWNSQVFTIEGL